MCPTLKSHIEGKYIMRTCVLSCPIFASLRPHGLQHTRLLRPWNAPGKSTGVGHHFLLQGNLPCPGMEPESPALAVGFFTTEPPGKSRYIKTYINIQTLLLSEKASYKRWVRSPCLLEKCVWTAQSTNRLFTVAISQKGNSRWYLCSSRCFFVFSTMNKRDFCNQKPSRVLNIFVKLI